MIVLSGEDGNVQDSSPAPVRSALIWSLITLVATLFACWFGLTTNLDYGLVSGLKLVGIMEVVGIPLCAAIDKWMGVCGS